MVRRCKVIWNFPAYSVGIHGTRVLNMSVQQRSEATISPRRTEPNETPSSRVNVLRIMLCGWFLIGCQPYVLTAENRNQEK